MTSPPHFHGLGGRTAYEVLGVAAAASDTEITVAFRRRLKEGLHPDRGGSTVAAQEIGQAYGWLRDHRAAYDEHLSTTHPGQERQPGPDDVWHSSTSGTGGTRPTNPTRPRSVWDEEGVDGSGWAGRTSSIVPPVGYTTLPRQPPGPTGAAPGAPPRRPAPQPPPVHPPVRVGPSPGSTDPWAVAALALSLTCVLSALSVPLGVIALRRIARDGTGGTGYAITALVIGATVVLSQFVGMVQSVRP